jgi:hypothetical protein
MTSLTERSQVHNLIFQRIKILFSTAIFFCMCSNVLIHSWNGGYMQCYGRCRLEINVIGSRKVNQFVLGSKLVSFNLGAQFFAREEQRRKNP